jgi:single-stranded-DNA-specific exonuclease
LVLAQADATEYRGSGRGVPGINLVQILHQCKDHLLHWGGHPVAVGLSLHEKNIDSFTKAFIDAIFEQNEGKFEEPSLQLDLIISSSELQPELLNELNLLTPFGQENPEPILAIRKTKLAHAPKKVGSGEHFQFSVHNGTRLIQGIAWKMASRMPPADTEIDLAFRLRWNEWNGRKSLQMVLEDWKVSV